MRTNGCDVGLIGCGAFGSLAARCLGAHARVLVHDPGAGAVPCGESVGLEAAAGADVVVLAVPVQAIAEVCERIGPLVKPGALVVDVASVKVRPMAWMLGHLPAAAQVVGTHPLFGPQTAAERAGIAGEPIALCRGRVEDETFDALREFLSERLGLRVVEMSAEEHDRQMALVQAVTHLIGHTASEMGLPELETGTLAYRRLLQMKRNTENDAPALYDAIQRLNPFAGEAREAFLAALVRAKERADGLGEG